jgi:hypothetical protein
MNDEKTYAVGDVIKTEEEGTFLISFKQAVTADGEEIQAVSLSGGDFVRKGIPWNHAVKVKDPQHITKDEMDSIFDANVGSWEVVE